MRTYVRLGLLLAVVLALAVLLPSPEGASGTTTGYPDSMASLGDSITRARNPAPSLPGDQPQYSWSTGDSSTVQSHYYRILQQNSLISGNNYNDAFSGTKMVLLDAEAGLAVSQGVEYVTILMGANDVCTSSEATMTAVETFRSQFEEAMGILTSGLPDARIFVASIPDIHQLWFILKDNPSAVSVWNTYSICQSMLANPTSTAQADVERRERVRQRNIDFNTALSEVCALYAGCRFDNNAVFNTEFVASDVSTLDYFHLSIAGQTKLASVTWGATYDFLDSDGDGVPDDCDCDDDNDLTPDGQEIRDGTDPFDPEEYYPRDTDDDDSDNALNWEEFWVGTDPGDPCSDDCGTHDAWAYDINMDCWCQSIDILMFPANVNMPAQLGVEPTYQCRYDLNGDSWVQSIDILMFPANINMPDDCENPPGVDDPDQP